MGTFSKLHRFHEAGEGANVMNTEQFGTPAYSLYTSTKVFTLHHHIDVMGDEKNIVYQARSKFMGGSRGTVLFDPRYIGSNRTVPLDPLFSLYGCSHGISMALNKS